ncbi:MAG: DUF2851 family protein [Bacteroidaceae bacterium]
MEKLLHYVWKHRILPLGDLVTTDGRRVEVLDPGTHNHDGGPDFFNAKVLVDGILWAGNVEIHLRSSDWFRHGHQTDAAYDGVILHVVQEADSQVNTSQGRSIPQVLLQIPDTLFSDYQMLLRTDEFPRCHRILPAIDSFRVHAWMDRLLAERMQQRAGQVLARVKAFGGDWERACFVTLCRNFGFGLNGDVFERWAMSVPLSAAGKHRDHLFQIEALFLGMAGLIDHVFGEEEQAACLHMQQEFAFLTGKFSLKPTLKYSDWRYLRTRPQNFPHVRIRQIARLYHGGQVQMDALLEVKGVKDLHRRLGDAGLSSSAAQLILINTIAPLLYAYGTAMGEEKWMARAQGLLEELPAENNRILRLWRECGVSVTSAADSQALIQLKKMYCDRLDCLRCQFGYAYLRSSMRREEQDKPTQNTTITTDNKG